MKKILFIFLIFFINNIALGAIKENIIDNLENTQNLSFNFEQNIDGKIETGKCVIEYPKKIFCRYNTSNKKILVSNGRSFVIKTKSSYYQYSIKRTPLNYILDKKYYNLRDIIMLLGYGFILKAKNEFKKTKKDMKAEQKKILEKLFSFL